MSRSPRSPGLGRWCLASTRASCPRDWRHRPRPHFALRVGSGDYTVLTGEWEIGRIYQTCSGPDSLRWIWSMNANGPMTRSGRVATLEEAKAQFQKSWDAWKAWAKLEEVA